MTMYVSHGNYEDCHLDELADAADAGDTVEWTMNSHARPGDRIIFYIKSPISGFVALGTAEGMPTLDHGHPKYEGHYMAEVRVDFVLEEPLRLNVLRRVFPGWRWLKTPQTPCHVPGNLEPKLYEMFGQSADTAAETEGGSLFGASHEQIREMEAAAVEAVWEWFEDRGWTVWDRQQDGCGYDLHCTRGRRELHVEVKGVSGDIPRFMLTTKELETAKHDSRFMLSVVTSALGDRPLITDYTASELLRCFYFRPVSYLCEPQKLSEEDEVEEGSDEWEELEGLTYGGGKEVDASPVSGGRDG